MKILLDNGIFSHAEFMRPDVQERRISWGDVVTVLPVHGFRRKEPHNDPEYQRQIDALFTVGRLIREDRIEAYNYDEIAVEGYRGAAKFPACNALRACKVHHCPPPLTRSKFRSTTNLMESFSKGGYKDRKAGAYSEYSQISFFQFLQALQSPHVNLLIQSAGKIGLTGFEIESLQTLEWFQLMCNRFGGKPPDLSPENFPDVFHLWTAERNGLDGVLTLERKLPAVVEQVRKEKIKKIEIRSLALRPLDLLRLLGIDDPDPIPVEPDRFYHQHELPSPVA